MSQKSIWAFEIERALGLDTGAPTNYGQSVTGEPYIEFSSFGLFGEKEGLGGWVFSKEKAFELLTRGIVDYWGERRDLFARTSTVAPVVYWRILPELQEFEFVDADPVHWKANDVLTGYNFYARLLVSNKPVLEKAA